MLILINVKKNLVMTWGQTSVSHKVERDYVLDIVGLSMVLKG